MTESNAQDAYLQSRKALVEAQTAGQNADNRLAEALAGTAEMAFKREKLRQAWDAAAPALHRIYYFSGQIDSASVRDLIETFGRWDRIDNEANDRSREYRLILTSPGGDVITGFQAYSYLSGLSQRRPLTIAAAGLCASMATVLHQAASEGRRIIEPGCTYLLHDVSGGVGGRLDSMIDTTEWLKQINGRMHKIFADRSNKTEEEIFTALNRHEKFLSAEEVIEWGLADAIDYVT